MSKKISLGVAAAIALIANGSHLFAYDGHFHEYVQFHRVQR